MRTQGTHVGLSLLGAVLAIGTVLAQRPGPLPPVAGQMTVTPVTGPEALRPAEASVAINPTPFREWPLPPKLSWADQIQSETERR